jgi:UDPglucose 6-dehydrogenase
MQKLLIGFIGQGFVGKNIADDFENRGFSIVRYSLEEPFVKNKDQIKDCDIVFIAVPTPTTPQGFDDRIVREAVKLVGKGKIAIIKSTVVPGTTDSIQGENPEIFVMDSPEFLREATAAHDASHPERNIIGIPKENDEYREKAELVMSVLPKAPFNLITSSKSSECVKYINNGFLYTKVVFMNLAYEFSQKSSADWKTVRDAVAHDPRIGESHTEVLHGSGRGAGGHCFIKDFEALIREYEKGGGDEEGLEALKALREKNNKLLRESNKDLSILEGVYGPEK